MSVVLAALLVAGVNALISRTLVTGGDAPIRPLVWLAGCCALIPTLVVSAIAMRRSRAAARALTQAVRRIREGEFSVRTRNRGADEMGELGRALDGLAESLEQTVAQLKGERDLLSSILETMQEGVLVLDPDGCITLVNPSLRAMLLLSSDVLGRRPIEVIRHADLVTLLDKAAAGAGPVSAEIEVSGVKPRRLLVHADALKKISRGVLAVVVDATNLRRLESLRRDFVANVSHELRTPVTAIRAAAETLRDSALGDPSVAPSFLAMIERNAERLRNLVEDLLDLSRIESREYQLRPEMLELAGIVNLVQEGLRPRAAKRGIVMKNEVPGEIRVRADRRALEQVLVNLVDNAVKYGTDGCEVVVGARPTVPVTVSISDTGPGIPDKHVPRLFERFYRVDAGRSREMGGTGLGLAIVKHHVEAMGGAVRVESTVGKGSIFSFTLPGP